MKKNRTCYSCGSSELSPILDLGRLPQTAWLSRDQLSTPESRSPLEVQFCRRCSLVQIQDNAGREGLLRPGASPNSLQYLIQEHAFGPEKLVLNLEPSHSKTFTALVPVIEVSESGTPASYRNTLEHLVEQGIQADVVYVGQQLNRLSDPNGLVEDLLDLLKDKSVMVLESPYIHPLAQQRRFTAFYHLALYSFSVTAMNDLLRRHGLWLNRIEAIGGQLRYYASKTRAQEPAVAAYLEDEQRYGLNTLAYYQEFAAQVAGVREALLAMLLELRSKGKQIAAYGASAELTVLLNYTGLGTELVSYLVDPSEERQGQFVAGMHIPIYGPDKLAEDTPHYLLVLDDPKALALEGYFLHGGKLLVALPSPEIVNPAGSAVRVGA